MTKTGQRLETPFTTFAPKAVARLLRSVVDANCIVFFFIFY